MRSQSVGMDELLREPTLDLIRDSAKKTPFDHCDECGTNRGLCHSSNVACAPAKGSPSKLVKSATVGRLRRDLSDSAAFQLLELPLEMGRWKWCFLVHLWHFERGSGKTSPNPFS